MNPMPFGSHLRAARRLLLYLAFTLPLMPLQGVAVLLKLPLRKRLPRWYHRICLRILGFSVDVRGQAVDGHPRLFVANHVSYLDIMILGAQLPGSFVAKAEVKAWPLFGWLARLQETVFVERRARHSAGQRDEIARRLQAGDDLILFPEGTSGNGERVLPFKSALFAVASDWGATHPLHVQPVSIAYTKLDGLPMGRYLRPFFAWYGDMEMAGHLWQALALGRVTAQVEFHRAVFAADFASRKELAAFCQREAARGLAAALAGRPTHPEPALPATRVPSTEVGTDGNDGEDAEDEGADDAAGRAGASA